MEISRSELYAKVSEKPLSKLASDFQMSPTALSEICKRHDIPFPGSAYWSRKSMGLATEIPALPAGQDTLIVLSARVTTLRTRAASPPHATNRVRTKKSNPPRPKHHPLLIGVEQHFRKSRKVDAGEFLKPYKKILPDINVSEDALRRALVITDSLYWALDQKGFTVRIGTVDESFSRVSIEEREVERKDRKYGQYGFSSRWAPDRPTVVYINGVPVGLTVTEMTERVTLRYLSGVYYREDSKLVQSLKSWQLHNSRTTVQDWPTGRFKVVAYSPIRGVEWSVEWQEAASESLIVQITKIVDTLTASTLDITAKMVAAETERLKRQRAWEEQRERYRRQEDARRVEQAIKDSSSQLTEIIESWGRALTIERFFTEAEQRLSGLDPERAQRLKERLQLAREMIGTTDALEFVEKWVPPCERYRSEFVETQ